ncbi:MAG: hypothetical protein ABL973_05110 [Micropepsaceae bacterium]
MTPITLHWKKSAVLGDIARGSVALALSLAAAISFTGTLSVTLVCTGLAILFASYVVHCALKLFSAVVIDDEGVRIERRPLPPRHIPWSAASSFEVRHFSLGQFRKKSLMDMKLKGDGHTVLLDDGLENFPKAVQSVWSAVRARNIGISETTRANLAATGCVGEVTG